MELQKRGFVSLKNIAIEKLPTDNDELLDFDEKREFGFNVSAENDENEETEENSNEKAENLDYLLKTPLHSLTVTKKPKK